MDRRIIYPLLAAAAVAAVVAGVVLLGRWTRGDLERQNHLSIRIDDLTCPVPPGLSRSQFLAEVQYVANLPDSIPKSDPNNIETLTAAFAQHPWVERVDGVELNEKPTVRLTLRQPTLVIGSRILDRVGILLPETATAGELEALTQSLPSFRGPNLEPRVASGQAWHDAGVVATSKIIAWLRNQEPNLKWSAVELTPSGLVLFRADGAEAIWGGAASDPPADAKLARLRTWTAGRIDLRK